MTNPSPPTLPSAAKSLSSWLRFLLPASLGLAADLYLKAWAFPNGVSALEPSGRHPVLTLTNLGWRENPPIPVIPRVLGFVTTVNRGAVFGLFQGKVLWFLAFSILAMAIILWVFLTTRKNQWLVHLSLGLITAGALGNLYDRALFAGVRDMLKFLCFHFPPINILGFHFPATTPIAPDGTVDWYPYIFNIADALLCIGVPLLMLYWLRHNPAPRHAGSRTAPPKK